MKSVRVLAAVALGLALTTGALAGELSDALKDFRAGRYAEAASTLNGILEANPGDLGVRFWLGRSLLEQGKLREAEGEFLTILGDKPGSADSRLWLGVALAKQGKKAQARQALEAVLEAQPKQKLAREWLAKLDNGSTGPPPTPRPEPSEPGRIAVTATGLSLDVGQVSIDSQQLYDYTFSTAPTDWIASSGKWQPTNRWTCSPQWTWYGGMDERGVAASWNKHQFVGDVTVEIYAGMKMGIGNPRRYKNPNDMNITIHGDGANVDSGYSFIMGGEINAFTRIMKGDQVLAETRDERALFPIFEDAYPKETNDFHRKWWALRARLSGSKLQLYKDEELVLEAVDPDPLYTGRVGIWTMHNGIVVARAKIYYQDEKAPADPVPALEYRMSPPRQNVEPRLVGLTSETHPAVFDDFEIDIGDWRTYVGPTTPENENKIAEAGGARLELVAPGADGSGHALALVNQDAGGWFGARLQAPRLDARKFGRLAFDYNVEPDVKLNLYCKVNSGTYETVFTAPGEVGPASQILAEFVNVQADGDWHHAELDLVGYLERIYGPEEELWVEDVYFANTHSEGYIHAGMGGNHAGATLLVDNFYLGGAGPKVVALNWAKAPQAALADADADIVGCCWAIDDQPSTEPGEDTLTTDPALTTTLDSSGRYYAHVRPKLADGAFGATVHRRLFVDTDAPKVVSTYPKNGQTSGAGTIAARLVDPGGSGVSVGSLQLRVQGKTFTYDGEILQYNPEEGRLTFDPGRAGMSFENGEQIKVELVAATDRIGYALTGPTSWQWKYAGAQDKTPPTRPYIVSSDDYLCRDDFEGDIGEWSTFGGPDGAIVCRDPSTIAEGLYSLRLFNARQGGRFGAYIRKERFDVGKYRLMSFDYKCTGRLRADFGLYVNGRWRSIRFTDSDNTRSLIGSIPNVQTDGKWHHAEVNIFDMLRDADPNISSYLVRYLILADWGYMGNAAGRTYYVDNFEIIPVTSSQDGVELSWTTYDTGGIAGASYALDHGRDTDPGKRKMVDGTSVSLNPEMDGDCWFHVRSVDNAGNWSEPGHLRLILDRDVPTVAVAGPQEGDRAATSKIVFDLEDPGPAGIDPSSVQVKINDQTYDMSSTYLAYDADAGKLVWDGGGSSKRPVTFEDGQTVNVELLGAADFVGNNAELPEPFAWTMDYAQDKEPPLVTQIKSTSHLTLRNDMFEDGQLGYWGTDPRLMQGTLAVDDTTAASGQRCLKLTLDEAGGTMGAVAFRAFQDVEAVTGDGLEGGAEPAEERAAPGGEEVEGKVGSAEEEYSADRYPYISFDYNFDRGVHLDLVVQMDGEYFAVGLTDNAGNTILNIPNARDDGQWHHATVHLAAALKNEKPNGALEIEQVLLIDRGKADNKAGATARVDNFMIARVGKASPSFRWKATDATGVTDYSYVLDQSPTTAPDEEGEGLGSSKTFRQVAKQQGLYYFHIRAKDGAGQWGPTEHYGVLHIAAPKSS